MIKPNKHTSLYGDVFFLLFLMVAALTGVFMVLSGSILQNVLYLCCTVLLLMITYFGGLVASLIANMAFIAIQLLILVYQYVNEDAFINWKLVFWIVLPLLLCLAVYLVNHVQISLQKENAQLKAALIERGAFDVDTKLRTTVAYIEDMQVFIETHERFDLPVATACIKIRYFNELKRMMSPQQLKKLLEITSSAISETTRDNDITYLLERDDPTWAVLFFSDEVGTKIATNRIKEAFDKRLQATPELATLAVSMMIGIAKWDPETMKGPYELMDSGIRETQYDV
jgi:GGDEF domain-containing protein